MSSTKRRLLVGVLAMQAVLILFLGATAVYFRIEEVGAQAQVDYYRQALTELHEDHEEALAQILLYEQEELKHEYLSALDVAVKYGIITEKKATAQRIGLTAPESRRF
ncbi:MAG TPA: hypothetical protein VFA47_09330 [Candidatus Manganitrophaceae bacterium]|nr:hypothetical protein [Candidatus Manganitrophaceae bacterium]